MREVVGGGVGRVGVDDASVTVMVAEADEGADVGGYAS